MGQERSPLEQSLAQSASLLGGLLGLLTLVLLIAATLVFTIDEAPEPVQRGFMLLGLALFTGLLCALAYWASRRSPKTPAGVSSTRQAASSTEWFRRRLGPAWTDWLVPALPLLFVGLPLVLLRKGPFDGEAILGVGLLVGFLELLILVALTLQRREPTRLTLIAEGLVVTQRNGRQIIIRRGELDQLRLAVERTPQRGDTMEMDTLTLQPAGAKAVRLREPMSAPIPEIARACAEHMGVDVVQA